MHTCYRLGDRDRFEARDDVLDKRSASGTHACMRAKYTVQQLADRDDADGAFFLPEHTLEVEGIRTSLQIDQQIGVD
jgi:hypothetical protein